MKIELTNIRNGILMTVEVNGEKEIIAYQEPDEDCEVTRWVDFLHEITDAYGPTTSRYSKKRVQVTTVTGDKYEDSTDIRHPLGNNKA